MINLGKNCNLDIQKLIATRMLINANSGGGKSWAIRRFLEQSNGKVQQIILDLEGEFTSLREKYDYLLVGKDGEIPISIRTAELLAKKLLELNVSTIIDLSELRKPERITFVKRFLDSLMSLPSELFKPLIVVIDEAHVFAPESKSGKAESCGAVIDLMTRGRKRGYCGILCTQRISKLNKDAMAECNNYMIGRTGLDIDQKRVGNILGFSSKKDITALRDLKNGEFHVYGSAFEHNGIRQIIVGDVNTTHPDRTRGIILKPSPTPNNIKKILKDVVDLPKEAEEELKTTQDMKNKIRELKTKLTILEKSKPKLELDKSTIDKFKAQGHKEAEIIFNKIAIEYEKQIRTLEKKIKDIGNILGNEIKFYDKPIKKFDNIKDLNKNLKNTINKTIHGETVILNERLPINPQASTFQINSDEKKLRAGAMKILGWLAGSYPNELTKQRIATLSGFSVKGGTFNTYISELKRNGWITGLNELTATEEGLKNSEPKEIPSGEELLSLWKTKFRAGAGKILQFLYESYPNETSKEEIGYSTGFEPTGGTFNTYISELRRTGLIEINDGIKISNEFFE